MGVVMEGTEAEVAAEITNVVEEDKTEAMMITGDVLGLGQENGPEEDALKAEIGGIMRQVTETGGSTEGSEADRPITMIEIEGEMIITGVYGEEIREM
jgi:hypothetical protein